MDFKELPFWMIVAASLISVSLQGEYQRKLYKELMKNYNPLERPVANDSLPLTVSFGLSLMQIMDVDEKNQVLTTNIWLQMYWTDYYLQWNMSEYPGVKNVRFPDGQIWKPDILLYNRMATIWLQSIVAEIMQKYFKICSYWWKNEFRKNVALPHFQ